MRVLRFFFRNWLLKIGAVVLAVLLYGAMVFLQSSQQWPGSIAIEIRNQPTTAFLIEPNQPPIRDDIERLDKKLKEK